MVNLKNYNVGIKFFVLFLTFTLTLSCSQQKMLVTRIEGKEIGITEKQSGDPKFESFIKPYRDNIDNDLNTVLAVAPQTLDKSGQWQSTIGNLMADVTLAKCNTIFLTREHKNIDLCLLNHGGIRSIIAQGNVTARTAYEIMPFENSAYVVALKGEQLLDMANYIIAEKKPHPLSGMAFTIGKDNHAKNITIGGKPLSLEQTYYVVTSDYLINGGDNMVFFKKATAKYDLDYKLRNVLIDYFKEVDTIPVITNQRIFVE